MFLAAFDDFIFSPILINIATVEAAKAKGMHGCVAQLSCLCFVFVFTLQTATPLKYEHCFPELIVLLLHSLFYH